MSALPMRALTHSPTEDVLSEAIDAEPNLTKADRRLLRTIIRLEDAGMTTNRQEYLCGQAGVSRSTCIRSLARLERMGHIERTGGERRRQTIIAATRWKLLWSGVQGCHLPVDNLSIGLKRGTPLSGKMTPDGSKNDTSSGVICPPRTPPLSKRFSPTVPEGAQLVNIDRRWHSRDEQNRSGRLASLVRYVGPNGTVSVWWGNRWRHLVRVTYTNGGVCWLHLVDDGLFEGVERVATRDPWLKSLPVVVSKGVKLAKAAVSDSERPGRKPG